MTCEFAGKLDLYIDSELPASELAEMQTHLQMCPTCAAAALSRLQLKRMNQTVGERYFPSPESRLKIEQGITPKERFFRINNWIPAIAMAATLSLFLLSAILWQRYGRSEQALSELADLHISTLASSNPVDIVSTDRHTVKPWFQGKLPFTFNLPELRDSPYKLLGGSLIYFQQN